MRNKKLMRMLIVGASIFALAGCGTSNDTGTNGERKTKDTYIENDITNPDRKDASDENDSKDTSNGNNLKDTPNGDNPYYYFTFASIVSSFTTTSWAPP